MNTSFFGRLRHASWMTALGVTALSPMVACGQGDTDTAKAGEPAGAKWAAVLPLKGDLPSDPATTALRVQKMNFPAGSSRARIYVQAPGLQTGTIDASGYVGSVSSGHERNVPQDFQLRLEPDQVRVLMSNKATSNDKSGPAVLIEAVDRAGKPVPGAKAELAILVDGTQLRSTP